jgi:hypothetical protein
MRILTVSTTGELFLKIGTALLIAFSSTLVLVHADIYLSGSLTRYQRFTELLGTPD